MKSILIFKRKKLVQEEEATLVDLHSLSLYNIIQKYILVYR